MSLINNKKGYTIVEVMIVLGVTGVMFAATVLLVQGQVAKNAFRSSAYNSEQMLAGIMNDVRVGYFNSTTRHNAGTNVTEYAGKNVTIDGVHGNVITQDLVSMPPVGSPPVIWGSSEVTSKLPSGLDFNDASFDVLFTEYTDNAVTSTSSTLGVKSFNAADPTNPVMICAYNGHRQVRFVVGNNGSPTVETIYDWDAGCP